MFPQNLSINETIRSNLDKISKIYQTIVHNINYYVDHVIYNNHSIIDNQTVSIVMTTHNRIKQTLFTLDTIKNSSYNNIQVIIVDDSTENFIDENYFKSYDFRIDYIKIKTMHKNWINPCINYNIGFRYIKGTYVIIQNAEVCHIGDVVSFVNQNCAENNYLVFDVSNTNSYQNNDQLYELFNNNDLNYHKISLLLQSNHEYIWYQHRIYRCENYHFLTAIHINDLKKLGDGFDIDFSLAAWYDDNELVFRIRHLLKLNIINIDCTTNNLMGIHQHHERYESVNDSRHINEYILNKKIHNFCKNRNWIYLYNNEDSINNFNILYNN